jgi:hypothetical protein
MGKHVAVTAPRMRVDQLQIDGRGGPPEMRARAAGRARIASRAGDLPFTKGQRRWVVRPQGRS